MCLGPIKPPSRTGKPIRLRLKKDPGWEALGWLQQVSAVPLREQKREAGDNKGKGCMKTGARGAGFKIRLGGKIKSKA